MMLTALRLSLFAVFAVFAAMPASAAVVAYTNFAAWSAAVSANGPTTNQGLNGAASNFAANTSGNVIDTQTTVDLIGGAFDAGPTGLTGNGYFQGEVDSSPTSGFFGDGLGLDFNFASGVGGFAIRNLRNDSSTTASGLQLQEIGVVVDGQSYLVSDLLGLTDSSNGSFVGNTASTGSVFLGFVSDTDLNGFSLIHGDFVAPGFVSGGTEEFYIGRITLAGPAPSTVPVPAGLPLLAAGLAAFAALGWRKQRHVG
jgi:hypothetical protein